MYNLILIASVLFSTIATAQQTRKFGFDEDSILITPNGGAKIRGITDGSAAMPGQVGEVFDAFRIGPASLSSGLPFDLMNQTIPAGHWAIFVTASVRATTVGDYTAGTVRVIKDAVTIKEYNDPTAPTLSSNKSISGYMEINSATPFNLTVSVQVFFSSGGYEVRGDTTQKPTQVYVRRIR